MSEWGCAVSADVSDHAGSIPAFAGTGTTLAVADLHGRDAIGVDIDQRNRDLYPARRAECAKSLFGTKPELPGQLDMFGGDA